MRRFKMSIAGAVLMLMVAGCPMLVPRASSQSDERELPKSRLGIKGVMGFIITSVDTNSTVKEAGLKMGDIVTDVGGEQINSIEQFQGIIAATSPGTMLEITYLRFDSTTGFAEQHKRRVRTMPFGVAIMPAKD